MLKKIIIIGNVIALCGASINFASARIPCPAGQVSVKFTGKGNTNAFVHDGIPASLGTVTLIEATGNIAPLTCAVRGVPTITGFTPPATVNAKFISYIQCRDRFHSELVTKSTAELTRGHCETGDYDPTNPIPIPINGYPSSSIKGPFSEQSIGGPDDLGGIEGKWGIFKDITRGYLDIEGSSKCGVQDWTVSAEVCMSINQNQQ